MADPDPTRLVQCRNCHNNATLTYTPHDDLQDVVWVCPECKAENTVRLRGTNANAVASVPHKTSTHDAPS